MKASKNNSEWIVAPCTSSKVSCKEKSAYHVSGRAVRLHYRCQYPLRPPPRLTLPWAGDSPRGVFGLPTCSWDRLQHPPRDPTTDTADKVKEWRKRTEREGLKEKTQRGEAHKKGRGVERDLKKEQLKKRSSPKRIRSERNLDATSASGIWILEKVMNKWPPWKSVSGDHSHLSVHHVWDTEVSKNVHLSRRGDQII